MIEHTPPSVVADGPASDRKATGKPCIALMGEFSAGKTTLINFLIGSDVLPTKITATQVPPVWLSYGEDDEPFYVDSENRSYPVDLMDIQNLDVKNVRYIKVFAASAFLKSFDLIDTPGISDPNIPEFHRDTAINNANAILWCTHATQAWRESENSAWSTVPEPLQASSILVATRADKLDERNRERVKKRLQREAGGMFSTILMFSAIDALKAKSGEGPSDLMEQSGGAQLLKELWKIAGRIAPEEPAAPLTEKVDAPVAPVVRPVRVTNRPGRNRQRISADDAQSLRSQLLSAGGDDAPENDAMPEPVETEIPDLTGDEDSGTLLHLSPEGRADPLDDILEQAMESDAAPEEDIDAVAPPEIEDDMTTMEPLRVGRSQPDDEDTLSALKAILHEDPAEPDDTADEPVAEQDDLGAGDPAILPLELWGQVQQEYKIETVDDVTNAVSILLEVMQEHRICFSNCCQPRTDRNHVNEGFPVSLSG